MPKLPNDLKSKQTTNGQQTSSTTSNGNGEVEKGFPELLTEHEYARLILALAGGRKGPITDDEASLVLRWARGHRIGNMMLDLVLAGKMLLNVVDGDVAYGLPTPADEIWFQEQASRLPFTNTLPQEEE